jgi:hypothetical protein
MANLTDAELEEIVKQSLPGYKISPKSQVAGQGFESASASTDASAARAEGRAENLRRRYLGTDAELDADDEDRSEETAIYVADEEGASLESAIDDEDDEMIVAVEPETSADPLDRGSRAKAAVISKKEKKVIGQQG